MEFAILVVPTDFAEFAISVGIQSKNRKLLDRFFFSLGIYFFRRNKGINPNSPKIHSIRAFFKRNRNFPGQIRRQITANPKLRTSAL